MARGRSKTANDWRRFKKFEEENQKLRKEVAKLRKIINSMVIDQLEERVERIEKGDPAIKPICEQCGNEDLHHVPLKRTDGDFEIRICKSCSFRSGMKKVKC